MKASTLILALTGAVTSVKGAAISDYEAAAIAERTLAQRSCRITFCKGIGKVDCEIPKDPEFDCELIHPGPYSPYVSGFTSAGCRCEVYEHPDCTWFSEGQWQYVYEEGLDDFGFGATGYSCQ